MNIDRLETHDRLLHFQKQEEMIYEGCMECIKNVPEGVKSPFYVFAHPRSVEKDEQDTLLSIGVKTVPNQRLIWMPRITKPEPQTNSYLFLARKNSDVVRIIWMLPNELLWSQYAPGKMTYNEEIWTSIQNFKHAKHKLSAPDKDGPTKRDEEEFRRVIAEAAKKRKMERETQKITQASLEEYLSSLKLD